MAGLGRCVGRFVDLLVALQITPGERLALVGGGGKTGLAGRLLAEAQARGWTALFTTTTKIFPPDEAGPPLILAGTGPLDLDELRRRLREERALILARGWSPEWEETPAGRRQKLAGLEPAWVDGLACALEPDLLIVEADGSRHRPFKAPAPYEPVIPSGTTLVAVLVGLTVLGQPLAEPYVHRPERAAALAGVPMGVPVDGAVLAAVLSHPEGGGKGIPPAARAVVVLTQANAGRRPAGREVARRLLPGGSFERVLLVDLDEPERKPEVWCRDEYGGACCEGRPHVVAVILAAGAARRMGQNKLLLPVAGKALLAHAVDAALGSHAAAVWVVLGSDSAAVRAALGTRPVHFLDNPHWAEGQAASIRAALAALADRAEGLLFLAGDMPLVSPTHLDRLMEHFRLGTAVVWSAWQARCGIPALFGREAFSALGRLVGETGGRALRGRFPEAAVPVAAEAELLDVDTPEDLEQARRWLEGPEH